MIIDLYALSSSCSNASYAFCIDGAMTGHACFLSRHLLMHFDNAYIRTASVNGSSSWNMLASWIVWLLSSASAE